MCADPRRARRVPLSLVHGFLRAAHGARRVRQRKCVRLRDHLHPQVMAGDNAYEAVEAAFAAPATARAREALSEQQRELLREFWLGRADGELTTALSFEFMLEDLRAFSAPAVLCELAERAVADEHRHVDWCLRFAAFWAGG